MERQSVPDGVDPPPPEIQNQPPSDVPGPLAYRSPLDEPVPPSAAEIFRGLFFGILALFAFLLAAVMADMAYAIHSGGRGLLLRHPDTAGSRPPSAIGPGLVAMFCVFAAIVLFRMARRSFVSRHRRLG